MVVEREIKRYEAEVSRIPRMKIDKEFGEKLIKKGIDLDLKKILNDNFPSLI